MLCELIPKIGQRSKFSQHLKQLLINDKVKIISIQFLFVPLIKMICIESKLINLQLLTIFNTLKF